MFKNIVDFAKNKRSAAAAVGVAFMAANLGGCASTRVMNYATCEDQTIYTNLFNNTQEVGRQRHEFDPNCLQGLMVAAITASAQKANDPAARENALNIAAAIVQRQPGVAQMAAETMKAKGITGVDLATRQTGVRFAQNPQKPGTLIMFSVTPVAQAPAAPNL